MKLRQALLITLSCAVFVANSATAAGAIRPESEDKTIYDVIIDSEETYSIWPADRENPLGWDDAGKTGTKEECLAWIKEQSEKRKTRGSSEIRIPAMAQNGGILEIKPPSISNLTTTASFQKSKRATDVRSFGHHVLNIHGRETTFWPGLETTEVTIDGQLAEVLEVSDRKIVVRVPDNLAGLVKIRVKYGDVEAEGACRVVNVKVTATKTNLLKGERATVTVIVTGLDGINRTIPLHLTSKGVINTEGGNMQFRWIHPRDVQHGGTYTTTLTITGKQAGGFSVTAIVVTKPQYIKLQKDAGENGWRVKKDGTRVVFIIDNVKDPLKGGLLEGDHVLETGCVPGTLIKSLIPVLVKRGNGQVSGIEQPNGLVNYPILGGNKASLEMGEGCPTAFFGYPGFNAVIGNPIPAR